MKMMKERRCERESSLNTSLSKDDTDIFEEGIESPHCWHFVWLLAKFGKKGKQDFSSTLKVLSTWRKLMNP